MHMLRAVVLGMAISGGLVLVSHAASENKTLEKFVRAGCLEDRRLEKRAERFQESIAPALKVVHRHRHSWVMALLAQGFCAPGSPEKKIAIQSVCTFAVMIESLYQKTGVMLPTWPQGALFASTCLMFASWESQAMQRRNSEQKNREIESSVGGKS